MQDLEIPWIQKLLYRFSHRITRKSKLPKGDVRACLRNLARRGFYPQHVVDVGANRGRFSRKVHDVFPQARLTLVEPQLEMKPHLDRFCARTPGARWIQAGAAAASGELPFTLTGPTDSTFTVTAEEATARGWQQRKVRVITLDELCANILQAVPDMVKIDAEGFEFEILKGATSLLGRTELFVLELPLFTARPGALRFVDGLRRMAELGYEAYDFTWFQKRPYDGAIGQADVVFARRDGFLRAYKGWAGEP